MSPITRRQVPYTVLQNGPVVLEVDCGDGTRWKLYLTVAIMEVVDTGVEQQQPTGPTPVFEMKASLITEIVRLP